MALAILAGCLGAAVAGFALGLVVKTQVEVRKTLRAHGFTKDSAGLFRRAMKTLNRMITVTDLDGDFAADILSPETRKQVEQLLTDYRKMVSKE